MLYVVLALVLAAEFVNGWTDAPNAIATVVATRTLSLRSAVLLATIFNTIGAFFGAAVAITIAEEIIHADAINLITLGAALIAVISWSLFAWKFGIPTSETHALVSGITGAALAIAGPSVIIWSGWGKIFVGLLLSTFSGAIGGWLFAKIIYIFFKDSAPMKCRRTFGRLQLFSASFMAFSHGSNDGQKFIGTFALALLLGGIYETLTIPFWVILLCAIVMGLGTTIGGLRIIRTMGIKLVKLESYQGFAAETSAALTISIASIFGVPLSTTHSISSSIVGVGFARRKSAVRWTILTRIVYAWLLTFPICILLAYLLALIVNKF